MEEDIRKDIRKDYEAIRKKFKLPEYLVLDKEFEISDLERSSNILRAIRSRISEKIRNSLDIFEEILQPDTNLSTLYESRVFDDSRKREVFDLYRQVMKTRRKADQLEILNDDSQDAEFISKTLEKWQSWKPTFLEILKLLEHSWSQDVEISDKQNYLG